MVKELYELMPTIFGRYDEVEMIPAMKENGVTYIIYGAGQGGKFLISWIKHIYNIKPDLIVDRMPSADSIDGVPIISCEEFKRLRLKKRFFIIVAVTAYCKDKRTREEIDEVIKEAGTDAEYITYCAHNILAPYDLYWYYYIKEHAELFEQTYDWLADDISKETMEYYLRTIVLGEKYSGITFPERYKYWGMDSDKEMLFKLSEEEVLLNIGAARGDTVCQFLKCCRSYKKIIAVEGIRKPDKEYKIFE